MINQDTWRKKTNDTKRNKKWARKISRTCPIEDHAASKRRVKIYKYTINGDTAYCPAQPTRFFHISTEQNEERKHMSTQALSFSIHTQICVSPGEKGDTEEKNIVRVKNALVPMEHTAYLSISSRVIRVNMVHSRGKSHRIIWASVWCQICIAATGK